MPIDDEEPIDLPMYDANLRVMLRMLEGITGFAMDLAKDARITPVEVEELLQRIILPSEDDQSAMLVRLREQWEKWSAEMLAGVRVVAQAAARERS